MKRCLTTSSLVAISIVLLVACKKQGGKTNPAVATAGVATPAAKKTVVPEAAMAEAQKVFGTLCSSCHGTTGKGDGPAASALNPKPRNYTDTAWQKSVTDQQIADTIVKGGAKVGKSNLMPPNPQLKGKPEVVAGLVKIVRSFAKN